MLKTFRGGIHPPESKNITGGAKFSNLAIPVTCYIPLQQHIGVPAKSLVKVGDIVEQGQLIGAASGFVSANVHASVPGKVIDITDSLTVYQKQPTIVIEAEGSFTSSAQTGENVRYEDLSQDEILLKVKEAGVVGLGGAAFPASVKLSPPPETRIDTLIVNGAECEPYLTVDDMLMQTFPHELIEGIQITLKILGIKHAIIGVENNKGDAVRALQNAIDEIRPSEDISVRALRTKYPQGAEKQLIYTLLRKEVPSRGLPMDIGVVVQNIGTINAIREAVVLNKPLYERYITVSGKMINKPGNYKVRIGTRISDIVEECGGLKGEPAKIIVGGPMCGLSIHSMDMPVVKGTSGILFLAEDEVNISDYSPCLRCGKCVSACPIGLLPCDLGAAVENNRFDIVNDLHPSDCIMCGSCSYSCPAKRPLSHFIKIAQERIKQKK